MTAILIGVASLSLVLAALGSVLVTDPGLALPYVGLFFTSLVAGTTLPFLPGSSEMAMAGLLATGSGVPVLLIGAAIAGNFMGASANYVVGRNIARFSHCRWSPISPVALQRTTQWFHRYGIWLVLMCWIPMAGDAITLVAGLLRADLRVFLILAATGKAFGHIAVAGGVNWLA